MAQPEAKLAKSAAIHLLALKRHVASWEFHFGSTLKIELNIRISILRLPKLWNPKWFNPLDKCVLTPDLLSSYATDTLAEEVRPRIGRAAVRQHPGRRARVSGEGDPDHRRLARLPCQTRLEFCLSMM